MVTQRATLCQRYPIFRRHPLVGARRFTPYKCMGHMKAWATWRQALGLMPLRWWEMAFTEANAADARASRHVKCVTVDILSSSQKPSHQTNLDGVVVVSLMETSSFARGPGCWIVLQWISSVLGREKDSLREAAFSTRSVAHLSRRRACNGGVLARWSCLHATV